MKKRNNDARRTQRHSASRRQLKRQRIRLRMLPRVTLRQAQHSCSSGYISSVFLSLAALVFLCLVGATMGQKPGRNAAGGIGADTGAAASSSTPGAALAAFGIDLLKRVAPEDDSTADNVFISPWQGRRKLTTPLLGSDVAFLFDVEPQSPFPLQLFHHELRFTTVLAA